MNNLLKSEKPYLYKIEFVCLEEEICFVKGNINPKQFDELVFYLQVKLKDMLEDGALNQIDISDLLERFYDFQIINANKDMKPDTIIEIVDNWERNAPRVDDIFDNDIYNVEGVDEVLHDIMLDTVYTNPTVFHEKFMKLIVEKDGISYIPVPSRILDEVKKAKES